MFAHELPALVIYLFALIWGALWGSFANVAVFRWPRDLSVIAPASTCPSCGTKIKPKHNIPIFSWLLLRGQAACCGAKINPRYLLLEIIGAALCVAIAHRFIILSPGTSTLFEAALEAEIYFLFVLGLLIATFSDLETGLIPDEVSLPGAAVGLLTVGFRMEPGPLDAAVGAGAGFLLTHIVFVWGYEKITGRRGMGWGDPKLLFMVGAFLGWQGVLFTLFVGSIQGVIIGLILIRNQQKTIPDALQKALSDENNTQSDDLTSQNSAETPTTMKTPIVFGPFLALGALEYLFFGERLIEIYLSLFK